MSQQNKWICVLVIGFVVLFCLGITLYYFINTMQYRVDKNREAAVIQKTVLMFSSSVLSEIENNGTDRAVIALNNLLDMSIVGTWNNRCYLNDKEAQEIESYISRALEYRKMKPRVHSDEKSLSSVQVHADNILRHQCGLKQPRLDHKGSLMFDNK